MIAHRTYGSSGPRVAVLHGGPGAPGHMASVAHSLATDFRVIEPFQRSSGGRPLTVAVHVADLRDLLDHMGWDPVHLVGSSWGGMLALAFAAAHPSTARSLVLIGCGTFDQAARALFERNRAERTTPDLAGRLERAATQPDPAQRMRAQAGVMADVYSHDADLSELAFEVVDPEGHRETWDDMLRLQAAGVYPSAFAAIRTPVLMLHGRQDPHPGRMIRDGLRPHVANLAYHEWDGCGHFPWLERGVRDDFYRRLARWIVEIEGAQQEGGVDRE